MKVLMVLTSHDTLGDTGRKTGFWLEELAAPYYVLKDAGAEITLASPKGGQPPLDPKSDEPTFQTELTHRFKADAEANAQLARTVRLDSVDQKNFDTVFYPGGHGPMWDLAEDENSIRLIESFIAAGKTIALVCPCPGRPASCQECRWLALRPGTLCDRLHQQGRGGRRSHQCRSFPGRG